LSKIANGIYDIYSFTDHMKILLTKAQFNAFVSDERFSFSISQKRMKNFIEYYNGQDLNSQIIEINETGQLVIKNKLKNS
jgi:hypothetical protein